MLYSLAIGIRQSVLHAQYERVGREFPFTLESAIHANRIEQIYESGSLQAFDPRIEYPHGVDVWRTYTIGSEYVVAALCRVLPHGISLTERIRWVECAWFSLGIPLMAIWIGRWWGSITGGAVAAAFYAVSVASVLRSTGQEVSRENFALPFLIAHLALDVAAVKSTSARGFRVAALFSGLSLAAAAVSWDLIQYYVGLWMVASAVRLVAGDLCGRTREATAWRVQFLCLAGACMIHPYMRAHHLIASPVLLMGAGVFLSMFFVKAQGASGRRRGAAAALIIASVGAGWIATGQFAEHYGHFGELLMAKVVHLNQKPADPGLLTFNQRIMWVPALHSANLRLTFFLFPAMLVSSLVLGLMLLRQPRFRSDSKFIQLIFFCVLTLSTFCLFVRFHVFLAIFLAALLGCTAAWAVTLDGWKRWAILCVLACGFTVEAGQVVVRPEKLGRSNVYYRELEELIEWMGEHVAPEPVLAGFRTSADLVARADCPVLLHPKFETQRIRSRVEDYGKHLFNGTEESLRDWADGEGAGYFVYERGQFYKHDIPYQMRYMVDAVEPPAHSPALAFERGEPLKYFQPVWENRKYRVYRIRTAADRAEAVAMSFDAERAFQQGAIDEAESLAMGALAVDPGNERALKIVGHVARLREMGFEYEDESADDASR